MRRSLLSGLVGALVLLIIGVSAGYAGHARALTRERNDLTHDAAEQAQVLNAYFTRASSIILLTAHSSEYRRFYAEPRDPGRRGGGGGGPPPGRRENPPPPPGGAPPGGRGGGLPPPPP